MASLPLGELEGTLVEQEKGFGGLSATHVWIF
jgi:hypothetical protein